MMADCYAEILQTDPDNDKAFANAIWGYHEKVFDFPQAFELSRVWSERHPADLSAQCILAEKHFTTARFGECETRLLSLVGNPQVKECTRIALRGIAIANYLALGKTEVIISKIDSIIAILTLQKNDFKIGWTFEGAKQFIRQEKIFAPYRDWLASFFDAMEGSNRDPILNDLKQARANFRPSPK
jgi:hypothetical protein